MELLKRFGWYILAVALATAVIWMFFAYMISTRHDNRPTTPTPVTKEVIREQSPNTSTIKSQATTSTTTTTTTTPVDSQDPKANEKPVPVQQPEKPVEQPEEQGTSINIPGVGSIKLGF